MAGITEVMVLLTVMVLPLLTVIGLGYLVGTVIDRSKKAYRQAEDLRIQRMIEQHMVDLHPRKWEL